MIDWGKIIGAGSRSLFAEALERELRAAEYIDLSDVLTAPGECRTAALRWLEDIDRRDAMTGSPHRRTWTIRVIRGVHGEPPVAGEHVEVKRTLPLRDRTGRKLTGRAVNDARRRGTFERDYVAVSRYEIDECGCIRAPLADAAYLLDTFGVHHLSGEPLSGLREVSSGPVRLRDGSERHIWNWRYVEVPPGTEVPALAGASERVNKRAARGSAAQTGE